MMAAFRDTRAWSTLTGGEMMTFWVAGRPVRYLNIGQNHPAVGPVQIFANVE